MIYDLHINSTITYSCKKDLNNLKELVNNGVKLNYAKIGRELNIDYRTAKAYANGFVKSQTRNSKSSIDKYYDDIYDLLFINKLKVFHYKNHLYRYLCDKKIIENIKLSTFKAWLNKNEKLNSYFKTNKSNKANSRFETQAGKQAQVDWKEDVTFIDNNGDSHLVNVLTVILGYSRFRYQALTLTRTRDVLFHHLDRAFEVFGGVPECIVFDNMRTVMDESRTQFSSGKVNNIFSEFAKNYGFKVQPCIAKRPQTKAKVEATMKCVDIITCYNGDFGILELTNKINELCNIDNASYHPDYALIPLLALQKEKGLLTPLPHESIRNPYKILTIRRKVNADALINYKNATYSVPQQYVGKEVVIDVYDQKLHIYYSTTLITIHEISNIKRSKNYKIEHYTEILANSLSFLDSESIKNRALENLNILEKNNNDKTSNLDK